MTIITPNGQVDTITDTVVFMFNNDNELNEFLTRLAKIPVMTSGLRILPLVPQNMQLSPLQEQIFNVIGGLDGIGRNNEQTNDNILNDSISKLNEIINL